MAKKILKHIILTLLFSVITKVFIGQTINLDSCGIDTNPILNKFEIAYFNDVLFSDSTYEFKKGFDMNNKKFAFYSCGNIGFLSKDKYFYYLKPTYLGPKGLLILNEKQKQETGYDAIIMINCKAFYDEELIKELKSNTLKN